MLKFCCLSSNRSYPFLITGTETGNTDTGAQIDIFLTIGAYKHTALAGDDLHRESAVSTGHIFFINGSDAHKLHPFVTMVPAPSSVSSSIRME